MTAIVGAASGRDLVSHSEPPADGLFPSTLSFPALRATLDQEPA